LRGEEGSRVEQLLERACAQDAGLPEQRVDRRVRGREGRRVRARGARTGPTRSAAHRDDRLRPCDATGDARELPRVAEGLEVEEDGRRQLVLLPVLEEVVGGHVRLVADRDEAREAESPRICLLEE